MPIGPIRTFGAPLSQSAILERLLRRSALGWPSFRAGTPRLPFGKPGLIATPGQTRIPTESASPGPPAPVSENLVDTSGLRPPPMSQGPSDIGVARTMVLPPGTSAPISAAIGTGGPSEILGGMLDRATGSRAAPGAASPSAPPSGASAPMRPIPTGSEMVDVPPTQTRTTRSIPPGIGATTMIAGPGAPVGAGLTGGPRAGTEASARSREGGSL